MYVQRAVRGHLEDLRAQDLAVAGDAQRVGLEASQPFDVGGILQPLGLEEFDAVLLGEQGDFRRNHPPTATSWPIGGRDDRHHVVRAREEPAQDGGGEGRGSEKDDAHGGNDGA